MCYGIRRYPIDHVFDVLANATLREGTAEPSSRSLKANRSGLWMQLVNTAPIRTARILAEVDKPTHSAPDMSPLVGAILPVAACFGPQQR